MQITSEVINGINFSYDSSVRDRYILERIVVNNIYGVEDDLKNTLVIDVGAHIGGFSLLAASKGAQVIAIEPKYSNYQLLLENIAKNPYKFVKVLNCAISDIKGRQKLYISDWCSGCNSLNIKSNNTLDIKRYEYVYTDTFESIINNYSVAKCSLLKVDCEGAEEFIIPYVLDKLIDVVDALAVEFHSEVFFNSVKDKLSYIYPLNIEISPLEWKFSKYSI